jgi:hypothetical protein
MDESGDDGAAHAMVVGEEAVYQAQSQHRSQPEEID